MHRGVVRRTALSPLYPTESIQRWVLGHVPGLDRRAQDALADRADDLLPEVVASMEDEVFFGFERQPAAGLELALQLAAGPAGVAREEAERLGSLGDHLLQLFLVGGEVQPRQHFHLGGRLEPVQRDERTRDRTAEKDRLRAIDLVLAHELPDFGDAV